MPASASSSLSKAPWATPARKEGEHAVMDLRAKLLSIRRNMMEQTCILGHASRHLQAQAALRDATQRAVQQRLLLASSATYRTADGSVSGRQQKPEKPAASLQATPLLRTRLGGVRGRAPQLFLRHFFHRNALHHFGPGEKHIGRVAHLQKSREEGAAAVVAQSSVSR